MCVYYRNRTRTEIAIGTVFLMFWSLLSISIFQISFADHDFLTVPLLTQVKPVRKNVPGGENVLQVVHIDLKGSPPKIGYLEHLLTTLSRAEVRAVMIEYDDMFPYQDSITDISAHSAFSKKDISSLVTLCQSLNIEIIPMIQTFGHLEFILKLDKYRHFREDTFDNRAICPSHPQSLELVQEMIVQMLKLHPNSRRIHIGCDKIEAIKKCDICRSLPDSEYEIFIKYITSVATFIRTQYANKITPIMWDNMLRPISLDLLKKSNLENLLEIAIQDVNPVLSQSIREDLWPKYTQVFKRIWLAGAFRGADNAYSLLPILEARCQNQEAWFEFMYNEVNPKKSPGVTLVGYILTGSSKADHFASSVDLLPLSVPSLLFNALKMSAELKSEENEYAYLEKFNKILQCNPAVRSPSLFNWKFLTQNCNFAAKRSLQFTMDFLETVPQVNDLYRKLYEFNPWVTPYHVKRNFINSAIIGELYEEHHFKTHYRGFYDIHSSLMNDMRTFFKENITQDWFLMYVETYDHKMRTLHNVVVTALNTDTFLRRE